MSSRQASRTFLCKQSYCCRPPACLIRKRLGKRSTFWGRKSSTLYLPV